MKAKPFRRTWTDSNVYAEAVTIFIGNHFTNKPRYERRATNYSVDRFPVLPRVTNTFSPAYLDFIP